MIKHNCVSTLNSVIKRNVKKNMSLLAGITMVSALVLTGCGKKVAVSRDVVGDGSNNEVVTEQTTRDTHPYDISLTFTGDINLAEGEPTTKELDKNDGDITKCISPELIKYMNKVDTSSLA